jgi:hypothetical protein
LRKKEEEEGRREVTLINVETLTWQVGNKIYI